MKRVVIVLLLSVPFCACTFLISATTLYVEASVAESGTGTLDEGVAVAGAANAVGIEFPGGEGSTFAIESIVQGTTITWDAEPGLQYVVWWSPSLDPPLWQNVETLFSRTRGVCSFFDPQRFETTGFYRIESGIPMVLIPGSDGGGVDYSFYIGKYEVTTAEYARLLEAMGDYAPFSPEAMIATVDDGNNVDTSVPMTGWEDRPIQNISYDAALAFCNWLSGKEGLQKVYDEAAGWAADISRNGYRLPTSKEWYKAAYWDSAKDGIGGFWKYACGSDELEPSLANYRRSGDPYEYSAAEIKTTPVGFYNGSTYRLYFSARPQNLSFQTKDAKNHYGCYDMEGNAAEYVMIESDSAFEPGGMGSSWMWAYPSSWSYQPISEPVPIRYRDRIYSICLRLARTAP